MFRSSVSGRVGSAISNRVLGTLGILGSPMLLAEALYRPAAQMKVDAQSGVIVLNLGGRRAKHPRK